MKLWYVLLIVVSGSHLLTDAMHGGDTDYIEEVPYMAQVFRVYKYGLESFCGAAILAGRWLVTAAHCMAYEDNLLSLKMRVGTNDTMAGGQVYDIFKIIDCIPYSENTTRWNGDLSLVKLKEWIKFDENRQPISISKVSPKVGDEITVTGYGDDYDDFGTSLKVGHQIVISIEECREAYSKVPDRKHILLSDKVFCTNSTTLDLCSGDSGSPGVMNDKIVGIAVEGCESPLPNVYVDMAYYYDWIYQTIGIRGLI